jgi:hypothetical protein
MYREHQSPAGNPAGDYIIKANKHLFLYCDMEIGSYDHISTTNKIGGYGISSAKDGVIHIKDISLVNTTNEFITEPNGDTTLLICGNSGKIVGWNGAFPIYGKLWEIRLTSGENLTFNYQKFLHYDDRFETIKKIIIDAVVY